MTLTSQLKTTDKMFFGKFNGTALNREVRIRFYEKNSDGTYKRNRLLTARQMFELLGEERSQDVIIRFMRCHDDDFGRSFRSLGKIEFSRR